MQLKHLMLGLLALLMASLSYAQPFTYQGFLKESGTPANGNYQMSFRLFSVASGGTAIATIGPVSVSVSNGLFTQELNFGSVWDGSDRYLEIQVGSIVLAPRVKINPAPYAGYSTATRGLNVDGALNVGLTALRKVIGFNPADAFPHDGKTMGNYTIGWFDDSWNGSGATAWLSGFAGIKLFTLGAPRLVINQAGSVGIGTTAPSYPLHVQTGAGDRAIYGHHTAGSGANFGVYGQSNSVVGSGVYGISTASAGVNYGVYGRSLSATGIGVYGISPSTSGANHGVYGQSDSPQGTGVKGFVSAGSGSPIGVSGESASPEGRGVVGNASASSGTAWGVFGSTNSTNSFAYGVLGFEPLNSPGHAVYALGTLAATGTKSFQIDHPLHPETHLLNHFCSEGPEPYNIYRGNVVTDARGYAVVQLPDYFESINRDPTYHLTVIGVFAQAIVAEKVKDNRFVIRTDKPNVEVSWRVEAIRNDRWVQQYGYQTVQEKEDEIKGKYLNPELYGQPKEQGIHYRPEPERPTEQEKP